MRLREGHCGCVPADTCTFLGIVRETLRYSELMRSRVVTSSPDVMGGTPVFAGTRVPIENLLDYLEGGESIEDFLEGFPSVTREQVITFLEETKAWVLAEAG
jgi:uncharacterized protein (DUF433 family)